ncbi:ArsR family transcriptional regulator [Litorimonas taeanensis]|uniref:ArsR family transcriptional regulator n=1 Tax=Litorimonas taeanensis TaxID=568099 RepID=A0A420WL45_9PROT|nr:metalloregulator ArsR/SmtB family transcription factor [Litorimonas taeanensis]RKQ71734.1 ArsR family transcriptional regulator [Litorimonas taeanensis]
MEHFASILKTMGHTGRLRILALLERGELTVTELVQILNLSQPRVTQYINSLESVGIIERLREGSWVFSRLKRGNSDGARLVDVILKNIPRHDDVFKSDLIELQKVRDARSKVAEEFFAKVALDDKQLGNEYLPQRDIEIALLERIAEQSFEFMIDMGTGTGRMLELFASQIQHGAGIDLSPEMLKVARHKLAGDEFAHISVQQGKLQSTPFKDGTADLITLHQVLHFLDDPSEAIAEAARVMRHKATLLIIDFEAHSVESFRDEYAHRRLGFSDAEIIEWSESVGLKIQNTQRVINTNNPAVVIWEAQKLS